MAVTVCAGAAVLAFTGAVIRLGIKALGTPAGRAAGNQPLQATAALLGGRFRDRLDFRWYQRPAMSVRPSPPRHSVTCHRKAR